MPKQSEIADKNEGIIYEVGSWDVLMGRGAPFSEHAGNSFLRQIVLERRTEYVDPRKKRSEKHYIAVEIMETIRANGGRFLKQIDNKTLGEVKQSRNAKPKDRHKHINSSKAAVFAGRGWIQVRDTLEIVRKVKQLLRDMAPEAIKRRAGRKICLSPVADCASKIKTPENNWKDDTPLSKMAAHRHKIIPGIDLDKSTKLVSRNKEEEGEDTGLSVQPPSSPGIALLGHPPQLPLHAMMHVSAPFASEINRNIARLNRDSLASMYRVPDDAADLCHPLVNPALVPLMSIQQNPLLSTGAPDIRSWGLPLSSRVRFELELLRMREQQQALSIPAPAPSRVDFRSLPMQYQNLQRQNEDRVSLLRRQQQQQQQEGRGEVPVSEFGVSRSRAFDTHVFLNSAMQSLPGSTDKYRSAVQEYFHE